MLDKLKKLNSTAFNTTYATLSNFLAPGSDGASTCAKQKCGHGLILPEWEPSANGDAVIIAYRTIAYTVILAYLLLGVSIITDRIVSAMEVIGAQKRTAKVKLKSGNTKTLKIPVWHPIVVSLTVFSIGTSAPEIFLPVIETFKKNFQGDALGPSLIIGSGAYHLFIITGVCMLSVRDTKAKAVEDRPVFVATTACAIMAYLWVYLVLGEFSPGIIEIWEAVVTLLFFPVLVVATWAISCRYPHLLIHTCFRVFRRSVSPTGASSEDSDAHESYGMTAKRKKMAGILQQLKEAHPDKNQSELDEMAEIQMLEDTPRSAAFYRLHATNMISGGANVISKERIKEKLEEQSRKNSELHSGSNAQTIGFSAPQISCLESCGSTTVELLRHGAGVNESALSVHYETEPLTAKAGVNFQHTSGSIFFLPGQHLAEIIVEILDDGVYEENNKKFRLKLSNPEFKPTKRPSRVSSTLRLVPFNQSFSKTTPKIVFGNSETIVSILDDDHCGMFMFEKAEEAIPDNVGVAQLKVLRMVGTKGRVALPYRISQGTAKAQEDYLAAPKGTLHFEDGQSEATVEVHIIDKNRYGDVHTFYIELLQPRKESNDVKNTICDPTLGDHKIVQIGICEDEEVTEALDRLLKMTDIAEYVAASTWQDQLREAVMVFHDDDNESTSRSARPLFYAIHFVSLPWRLLVALLPPARLAHGWLAFISLLLLIAIVSALIGDCATYLGCTIGLKDTVTAITLISCGMGLPDTFASRHAAIKERTADAAIGHVTSANAVSVFLGIGMSWTLGAFYQYSMNSHFEVKSSGLGFDVMLYCSFASAGVLVLLLRRLPPINGELGGPKFAKIVSGVFFIALWVLFVLLSTLESYCLLGNRSDVHTNANDTHH